MALSVRQESLKQVPWFSLAEWHKVYKQVYSNDVGEQTKGYSMLLAWKARISKLPVGLDCTLSIMQVCLRDLEWTPKINKGELPISYENDLCLMYSTTIMRFLNHISNIGHTKQTSLFQIAKQLNIPEWIVNLRHDSAHGYELPSIGVMRIAVNILLVWLHKEYWAAEAKRLEESYIREKSMEEVKETEVVQDFGDLMELWTAVNLYIYAGYQLVLNIPDSALKETLQDLRSYTISMLDKNSEDPESGRDNCANGVNDDIKRDKKYRLETARLVLLSEISRYLNKKSIPNKKDIVCSALLSSEAFLPSKSILSIFSGEEHMENELEKDILPLSMTQFWKDIIFLLYEKDILETLIIKLLQITNNEEVCKEKRLTASLWLSSIFYSFLKLDIAHRKSRVFEYELQRTEKKMSWDDIESQVKKDTDRTCPHLKRVLWLHLSDTVLPCLTNMKFISELILNVNEFSIKFISPILELVSSKIDKDSKQLLLNLINIYAVGKTDDDKSPHEYGKTFILKDLQNSEHILNTQSEQKEGDYRIQNLDRTIRNNHWKYGISTYKWSECPIGILPWQIDTMEALNPLYSVAQKHISVLDSEITPGLIDVKCLKMQSQINWDNVLRKKKLKRKSEHRNKDILMNKALEVIKKKK